MKGISALILAAGTASRMGCTKQLLHLDEVPLLERVVQSVTPFTFAEIIIVIGHDAKQIKNNIDLKDERCRWMFNSDYKKGKSHSLKVGIAAIQTEHVMVFLGDMPFISHTTIVKTYERGKRWAKKQSNSFVIRPVHRSVPGHPVFFGNIKQFNFHNLTADQGVRTLMQQMNNYDEIPVVDDGSILDIDTPEAYELAKQRWKTR